MADHTQLISYIQNLFIGYQHPEDWELLWNPNMTQGLALRCWSKNLTFGILSGHSSHATNSSNHETHQDHPNGNNIPAKETPKDRIRAIPCTTAMTQNTDRENWVMKWDNPKSVWGLMLVKNLLQDTNIQVRAWWELPIKEVNCILTLHSIVWIITNWRIFTPAEHHLTF